MVAIRDQAPEFTVTMAGGSAYDDIGELSLADALTEGPVVLAFFPAAFSGGCTSEMCAFRDSMGAFEALDAQVFGVSVDLPFALNRFIEENDLSFPMLSDFNQELIEAYGVVKPEMYGLEGVAQRSIFVVDEGGTIVYRWVKAADESPDFVALISEVTDALENL